MVVFLAMGCVTDPGGDSAEGTGDTAYESCAHPLSEFPDRSTFATLDAALIECAARGGDHEPTPCGDGSYVHCSPEEALYNILSLYFDSSGALSGASLGSDVPEFCEGTAWSEYWGSVGCS